MPGDAIVALDGGFKYDLNHIDDLLKGDTHLKDPNESHFGWRGRCNVGKIGTIP
jgi:hypothetical protein